MSKTTDNNGRLCNQIIRNLCMSILAEKNDMFVEYSSKEKIEELGIKLYSGKNKFDNLLKVTDQNYLDILNQKNELKRNLDLNGNYFQTEEITTLLFNYLVKKKSDIINNNIFKKRYNNNKDLFIHIRLTDASRWNPGVDYYLNTIKIINFDKIYIASDQFNHQIIKLIRKKFPECELVVKNEIETIQFGSTCKNIILSHGSYSAIIGYLSFFSNVYYLDKEPKWCPLGMFKNKGWNPIKF